MLNAFHEGIHSLAKSSHRFLFCSCSSNNQLIHLIPILALVLLNHNHEVFQQIVLSKQVLNNFPILFPTLNTKNEHSIFFASLRSIPMLLLEEQVQCF